MQAIRSIGLFNYVTGIFILLSIIYQLSIPDTALPPSPTYEKQSLNVNQKIINRAIVAGTQAGLGHAPLDNIPGIAQFKFQDLKHLTLHIPRQAILFKPNRPSGFIEAITLRFGGPATHQAPNNSTASSTQHEPIAVTVLLSKQANYYQYSKKTGQFHQNTRIRDFIQNWGHHLLGFAYDSPAQVSHDNAIPRPIWLEEDYHPSQKGEWDTQTGLVRYTWMQPTSQKYITKLNTLYFKPNSNPYRATQWIHCEDDTCEYNWFRNGLWVKTLFDSHLLPQHALIRAQVDATLDQFIIHND